MKFSPRAMSLSSSPFYASVTVILSLGLFMAVFWAFNEYQAYTESIENIRNSYSTRYRDRVREECEKTAAYLEQRRAQAGSDLAKKLQTEVLERMGSITFGRKGEVFAFRYDGTIISHKNKQFIGRLIQDIGGEDGFGEKMWNIAVSDEAQGFILYTDQPDSAEGKKEKKLAFVRSYPSWDWVLVASMAMDEMERAIENERKTYLEITLKNTTLFVTLFVFAVAILLMFAYSYSLRIKHEISLFTDFFRRAVDEKIAIEKTRFTFKEFEDLANLVNQMVEDMLQKELLIRRDELRLDTLLQLGMMDEQGIQEKYDFILHRIVEITGSDGGYLAIVNDAQSHLYMYSYYDTTEDDEAIQHMKGVPCSIEQFGIVSEAVSSGKPVVDNKLKGDEKYRLPYTRPCSKRLDIPIVSGGKVVVVAGVFSNNRYYDTSDIRQTTMLLEGVWLHVTKLCAEEEMARLERQIIAVSEEERSTIGRDLHDDLGSHLSGIELLCMVLQKKLSKENIKRAEELEAIRNLIREAIEITRRLAQGLYPVHVVEHGFASAVEELKVEVENLFQVECVVDCDVIEENIDGSVAIHLYYICREAVFNAARHGLPTRISITLRTRSEGLILEVEDDGRGFSMEKSKTGIGLHTMKYRAKAIGAALYVQSEVGGGTRIVIEGDNQL